MPAGYITLVIEAGSTFARQMQLTDANGDPRDLTGYDSAAAKIRKSYFSDLYVYTLTASIDVPATDGIVTISATAAETAAMKAGRYVYTVEIVNSGDSLTERILEGIIEVRPDAIG